MQNEYSINDVSAVVCTLNSSTSIAQCLDALVKSEIKDILVVDGGSTDSTIEIIKKFRVSLIFDDGKGLGAARNLGIQNVTTALVLNCGADNLMNSGVINSMLRALEIDSNLAGVSCRTKVLETTIFGKLTDLQWKGKISSGLKNIIGTPNIFKTSVLITNPYSISRKASDDEELCRRLFELFEAKFLTVNDFCLEMGQASWNRLIYRYNLYGKSDYEVWSANAFNWNAQRKLYSIGHPFRSEVKSMFVNLGLFEFMVVLPLAILSCMIRYSAWIRNACRFKSFGIRRS